MDSELLCGMENFEMVWKRVRGEDAPQCPLQDSGTVDVLHRYMDEKCEQAALYTALARCCSAPMQSVLLRLCSAEKKHFRCIQLEHFLLTGECYRPSEQRIKTDGFLPGLRLAWLREKESAQRLQHDAAAFHGTLQETLLCIAKEDACHAAELYALLKRCLVG